MGTDIHLYVEKFNGEKWERVLEPYKSSHSKTRDWSPWYGDNAEDAIDPRRRNYNLFAFLADVRNGAGFAGVFTHHPVKACFAGRGIPDDTSYEEPEYNEETDEETNDFPFIGDHSFTWATLDELLSAPWDTVFHSGGVVSPDGFAEWESKGKPSAYSGGIWGDGIVIHKDTVAYRKMIDEKKIRYTGGDSPLDFCAVTWTWQPLANEQIHFRRWLREILYPMCDGKPENIRIIIGFDS